MAKSGQYSKAIASYDKALKIKPDKEAVYYNKACCYSLCDQLDKAIESLQRAIELNPKYGKMAKTDSDFDNIRSHDRFKALIEETSNQREAID